MIVTVFRSRMRPEAYAAYMEAAPKVAAIAATMPGYISHKTFIAEDGERLTLVEFESEEALRGWSIQADHVVAKKMGRNEFFAEYKIQVCELIRERKFERKDRGALSLVTAADARS